MKKQILNFSILVSAMIFSVIITNNANAQSSSVSSDALSRLAYPIAELGSCKDRADCKIYCDDAANTAACISYAEKKNLLSEEDLLVAKKFVAIGGKGPGSCNGKEECRAYCEDKAHIDECVSYAEDNGLMPVQDLQKAKKVVAAIKKGVKFPACTNKKECDTYCEESSHMEECISFAKEAGLLSDQELENTQKVLTAVKQGVKPPACKGKDACDIYCAEESHIDECVNFAIATGLVTSEKAKIIKETGGKGPDGCKNKSECDAYCGNTANREICMNFAKEHNIPQPEPPTQPTKSAQPSQPQTGQPTPPKQGGGPNQGEGFNPGSGQGGGQNQNTNPNPVKCIEDCELVGNTCMGQAGEKSRACLDKGTYCRTVTCETFGAGGTRPTTQEEWNQCASYCRTIEDNCYAGISPTDSDCRTTKDVCVMECQKTTKPTKPTKPSQPQNGQPTQPTKPMGSCGDGKCGKMEQVDPTLCPQDCGGSAQPAKPSQPNRPTQPN